MKKHEYIKWSFLLLFVVMFVLPFFSEEGYSILKHTTSELGGQNTKNSFIMNISFILLGLSSIIEGGIYLKGFLMHRVLLILFGLSLIGAGVFSHMPIYDGPYSQREDYYHSIASSLTGFTFTMFAISSAFIERTKKRRVMAVSVAILGIILSLLMIYLNEYAGLWQRLIFISSFTWIIYFLNGMKKKT